MPLKCRGDGISVRARDEFAGTCTRAASVEDNGHAANSAVHRRRSCEELFTDLMGTVDDFRFRSMSAGPPFRNNHPRDGIWLLTLAMAILAAHAMFLHLMGRIAWDQTDFALWTSHAWASDTSQDLLDPYSFTHVIHGIAFYGLLHHFAKRLRVSQRLIAAILIEVGWELLENSPPVILRYRALTASVDYAGDSILNSIGDVLSCVLGFWLASRIPVKAAILLVILIELGLLATIRDNLTLNILALIHPIPALRQWQMSHGP